MIFWKARLREMSSTFAAIDCMMRVTFDDCVNVLICRTRNTFEEVIEDGGMITEKNVSWWESERTASLA